MLTFILGLNTIHAQDAVTSTYRFLQLPVSARSAALGGDVVSLPDGDVSLFQANPSYLQKNSQNKLSLSYINHISDINMAFLNGAYYLSRIGTIGAGVRYMNYGSFTRTNSEGKETGSFHAYDMAISIGIGRIYGSNLQYGAAVEFIHSSYDQYQSSALAITLGARYQIPDENLTLGAAITNLGTQLSQFDNIREHLPFNISIGASKKLIHVPLRLSLTLHSLNRWNLKTLNDSKNPDVAVAFIRHVQLGGEFLLSDHVFFRLGYNRYLHEQLKTSNRLDLAGTSIGIGIHLKKIKFDISRNSFSQLGSVMQINVSTSL
jgi:hypothetical protein